MFQLDAVADDLVHESFECDTRDHEDHTFCGVRAQRRRHTRNSLLTLSPTSAGDVRRLLRHHPPRRVRRDPVDLGARRARPAHGVADAEHVPGEARGDGGVDEGVRRDAPAEPRDDRARARPAAAAAAGRVARALRPLGAPRRRGDRVRQPAEPHDVPRPRLQGAPRPRPPVEPAVRQARLLGAAVAHQPRVRGESALRRPLADVVAELAPRLPGGVQGGGDDDADGLPPPPRLAPLPAAGRDRLLHHEQVHVGLLGRRGTPRHRPATTAAALRGTASECM